MPYKDLHSDPFDETTVTKLEIFEAYAEAWLPTFITQSRITKIQIFDLFAGPGYDCLGVPGSPIRLLTKINSFIELFLKTNTKVGLYFNEFEPNKSKQHKFTLLNQNVEEYLESNPMLRSIVSVTYLNEDSEILFFNLISKIRELPSLVYLDQNGVKFISQEFLNELERLRQVDFISFVSSSYFWRFGNMEEFRRVLPLNMGDMKEARYQHVHRFVIGEIRKRLPESTELKIFPFSLRKGSNIYGIIFGSKHFRAVDKFLDIAWSRNSINGEADFDIDEDAKKVQVDLFGGKQMTKVEQFKVDLEEILLNGRLTNNKDVLIYTYESGHLPRHAADVLKSLKVRERLFFEGRTPGVTYDMVFKNRRIITYKRK